VTALQAAGLVETLSGAGPFTVFAPTNEAFEALPPGTLDALLGNKTELTRVLTHHVAPGSYLATQVIALSSLQTVQGDPLEVAVLSGGGVRVGEANIVETDIRASNGVIHVIDAVLLPAAATATPTPTATTAATTSSPSPSGFDVLPIAVTALVGLAFLVGTRGHR